MSRNNRVVENEHDEFFIANFEVANSFISFALDSYTYVDIRLNIIQIPNERLNVFFGLISTHVRWFEL